MSQGLKRQGENSSRLESYKTKLENLRQEANSLKSQAPLSSSQQNLLACSSSISNLQHQNDAYLLKIQQEQGLIKDLERAVSELNFKMKEMRRTTNNNIEENKRQ